MGGRPERCDLSDQAGERAEAAASRAWRPTRRRLLQSAAAAPVAMLVSRSAAAGDAPTGTAEDLAVPAWVRRVARMTFAGHDAVALAAEAGAEVLHTNLVWPYFPLRADGGGLAEADDRALRGLVAQGRRLGVRIVLGLPPFPPVELVRAHPEWRIHADPTGAPPAAEPREEDLGSRIGCNLGPWGDYLIRVCVELTRDYGLDGFSFDGNYHPPVCYCPACAAAHRAERGGAIPAPNLDDVAYREYLVWRGEKLDEHYRELRRRIRRENPDAAVLTWTASAGRYGHLLTSPRVAATTFNRSVDMPMQEWWGDETNLGASAAPAFGAAYLKCVAGDRPAASEPYLMSRGNPYGTDSFPPHERRTRTLLALSHGCIAAESLGWPGHERSARESLAEAGRIAPWIVDARPYSWAGLLVSEQTRQFYAYRNIPETFLPHVYGAFRAAIEEHLVVRLLNDWDVAAETLAPLAALVLPNAAALSDAQAEAVRGYVRAGGGLVATCETSLCDELGRPRGDFALADVFGVAYLGRPRAPIARPELDANFAIAIDEKYWAERTGLAQLTWSEGSSLESAALASLVPTRAVNFRGPQVRASEPAEPGEVAMRMRPEGSMDPPTPAVVVRRYGEGRVVYFPAGVDAALWSYGYPYQRALLAEAVRWAARRPQPFSIQAPMCVQLTAFTQPGPRGERLVLHLFNGVNTTAHHGLPSAEVPLREETVPIHGIRVVLERGEWKSFRLQPANTAIVPKSEGDRLVLELPPLELHTLVVCET